MERRFSDSLPWQGEAPSRAPSLPLLVRVQLRELPEEPRGWSRAGSREEVQWLREREEGDEWVRRRREEVVVRRSQGGRGWGPNPLLDGRRERPHSVELGNLRGSRVGQGVGRGDPRGPWWGVVPCAR